MDRTLRIIIEGQDKSGSKAIKGINADLAGLAKGVGAVALAATGAALAIKKALDFGEEGAGITRLRDAGEDLARSFDQDFDTIAQAVQDASLDMVSEMDVMQAANRAMMLGVTADANQMAQLMEVAAYRARAMGLSTTQAFNDIVTGIGRMSPMILDNLGIVVDAENRYSAWASQMGVAVESIDAATKRQILLNAVLEEGQRQLSAAGGLTLDNAGKFERMKAAVKDAADAFKEDLAPAIVVVADAIYYLLKADDLLQDSMGKRSKEVANLSESYGHYIEQMVRVLDKEEVFTEREREKLQQFMKGELQVQSYIQHYEKLAERYGILTEAAYNFYRATGLVFEGQEEMLDLLTRGQLKDYEEMAGGAKDATFQLSEAQQDAVEDMARFYDMEMRAAAGSEELRRAAFEAGSQIGAIAENFEKARKKGEEYYNFSTGLGSRIAGMLEASEYRQAGGAAIDAAIGEIERAVGMGLDPAVADKFLEALFVEEQELQVELDNITADQAAQNISDTLGVSIGEAREMMDGIVSATNTLDGLRLTMEINVELTGPGAALLADLGGIGSTSITVGGNETGITTDAGHTGFARGVSNFVVPPGFYNDDFLVGLSSGERVNVQSANQSSPSYSYGGDTYHIVNNNHDRGAALVNKALLRMSARQRFNMHMD